MCDEGATLDEVRFAIHGIIARHGWFIQYVEASTVARSWAYTVGLSAGFGHPELIVVGVTATKAARVLNRLGDMVRDGDKLGPGVGLVDTNRKHTHFSVVHPTHFQRGVFAAWTDYYGCLGPPYPAAAALEVVLPNRRPRFASPKSRFGERA